MQRAIPTLVAAVLAACTGQKGDEKKSAPAPAAAKSPGEEAAAKSPGEAAARPASVTDADVALADLWTSLYGEYATALTSAAAVSDCKAAAAAIREVNRTSADLIRAGKPRIAELRSEPATATWLRDQHRKEMGAALDRMAPVLDRCRGNAEVSAALAAGAFERGAE